MRIIKQSTAVNVMVLLTSATDHIKGVENLTPNVFISKNCGNFVSISPIVESKGNGWYKIELTSSHTDTVGDLVLHLEDADADPADVLMLVKAQGTEDMYSLLNTTSQSVTDILQLCGDIPQILLDTTQLLTDIAQLSSDSSQATNDIFTLVDELHKVGGLNSLLPATTTPTSINVGTIHIDITGDGVTSTTFTRND